MPARHRYHHSSEARKKFTITLESCSRSPGIRTHDALETVTTIERNTQALAAENESAAADARSAMDALWLFAQDMGAYLRLYTFLSQIFDYGNTGIEKRAIFYRRLLPLLDFGREREGIDLSKIVLTHHTLKNVGSQSMALGGGETLKLDPITEAGTGGVQVKAKAYLAEIIEKVNDLFDGDVTDQDKLVYVNSVIKGKLMESDVLRKQAANNTKEQFGNSPDLKHELMNAIMSALDDHTSMSTQALNSESVQTGMKDILLNHAGLYESLRSAVNRPSRDI
jgi:type I restriction enzyme R subunit